MCTYFQTKADVAQNLTDNFFSNFDCRRTFRKERYLSEKEYGGAGLLMSSYIEEKLFVAASFYMAVAAYFYYEKVHRTMRTAVGSHLLK